MTTGLLLDDPLYFDRLALVDETHWWPAAMWGVASAWLDDALEGATDCVALDVGCGAGAMISRLSARREIAEVIGIDPNRSGLEHARSRCEKLFRGSALNLPFSDAKFDLATCFDVFQHLPGGEDRTAARELRRVVRPGGWILVRANGRGLWPDPAVDRTPYRLAELKTLLREAGLIVRKASYLNCLPSVASEILGKLRGGDRLGHPSGKGLRIRVASRWKNRVMGMVAGFETIVAGRLGGRLPIGHSTMVLAQRPHSEERP